MNENDNQSFIDKVLKDLAKEENHQNHANKKENLVKILKGKFKDEIYKNFYKVNNQTDPLLIANIKVFHLIYLINKSLDFN